MSKKTLTMFLIVAVIGVAGLQHSSLASAVGAFRVPDIETTAPAQPEKRGNVFGRVFAAPFKALGKLFNRKKKQPEHRVSEKDIKKFESTQVLRVSDASTKAPIAQSGEGSANDHLQRGRELINTGHLNEAIAELSLATSTDPSLSEAHNLLGVAYQFKRLPDMARRSFEAALKIDKNNLQTLNNLGYLLSSTGDYKGALPFLKKAARQAPDDPRVLNNLAFAQSQLGKFDEASKNFVRAGGEIKGRLNAADQLLLAGRTEEAHKQFEMAKLRARAQQKADASVQAITVLVELKNGRVTYASVSNRRPGLEAYEASALRLARQRRFPIDKNGQESVIVKVSPPPAS